MPKQSRSTGNAKILDAGISADAQREEFLKPQSDAAVQGAVGSALELLSFMSALPDAFVASQQREARRLMKSGRDKGSRIDALKASIEEAEKLRSGARAGQARADRALAALADPNDIFHGFVSDTDLQFQKGYTVRLVGAGRTGAKSEFSAMTEADGYFSITLATKKKPGGFSTANASAAILGAQLSALFGMAGGPATAATGPAAPSATTEKTHASVEILDPAGQVFHQDPVPVILNDGSVYREYVVESNSSQGGTQRYIGNPSTRELHDALRVTKRCNFDEIKPNVRVYFDSTAAAEKAGYDYCAYCFGKAKSKR
jgi:hypothetical protein